MFVDKLHEYLKNNLVGVYLHGSLAMGGFNPEPSDIDILVVVGDQLPLNKKKGLGKIFVELSEEVPGNGYELSIVTLDTVKNFVHPTPYELHFSYEEKRAFAQEKIDFTQRKTDPDLAAHFVITKERGVCLFGEPISEVFPTVSKKDYLDSLIKDAEWSYGKIIETPDNESTLPGYAILNFCRMLAFIQENLITSKLEGGEWALGHLPKKYISVVTEALEKKRNGTGKGLDAKLVKDFANYSMGIIRKAAESTSNS